MKGNGGAGAKAAFQLGKSARLGGKAMDLAQTQSAATSDWLGREERVEHLGLLLGRNADTGIFDGHADVLTLTVLRIGRIGFDAVKAGQVERHRMAWHRAHY